jgi:hypothetical protein
MPTRKIDVGAMLRNLRNSMRNPRTIAAIAVVVALCLGATVVSRATQDPYATKPQSAPATRPSSGGGGSLTLDQLGAALDSFHKNTIDDNGNKYYSVTADTGKVKFEVLISLSPNGHVIWITSDVTPMPPAGSASATAMFNLLKKNTDIGPIFFSINGKSLRISSPIPNYNMNAEAVKSDLMDLVNTAVDSQSLWNSGALGGR